MGSGPSLRDAPPVTRVVAWVPDLLFGSNVLGAMRAAGHDTVLVSSAEKAARETPGAQVLIVDLTNDAPARVAAFGELALEGVRTLAFYSHVEADVRALADAAGFDKVVPRSRMAREGAAVVSGLIDT